MYGGSEVQPDRPCCRVIKGEALPCTVALKYNLIDRVVGSSKVKLCHVRWL